MQLCSRRHFPQVRFAAHLSPVSNKRMEKMKQPIQKVIHTIRYIIEHFRVRLNDVIDLRESRYLDIQDIESVCLTLGPYRNLTTLTASVLYLHPNCQVLNHAGNRIYGKRKIDFLWDCDKDILDRRMLNFPGLTQAHSQ